MFKELYRDIMMVNGSESADAAVREGMTSSTFGELNAALF